MGRMPREEALGVLGLEADADEAAIRSAYKRAALKSHPDKVLPEEREEATATFQRIGEAYEARFSC